MEDPCIDVLSVGDWSLIGGGGGLQNGRGASEVLPLPKGGGGVGKSISHAEGGGGTKCFHVVSTW